MNQSIEHLKATKNELEAYELGKKTKSRLDADGAERVNFSASNAPLYGIIGLGVDDKFDWSDYYESTLAKNIIEFVDIVWGVASESLAIYRRKITSNGSFLDPLDVSRKASPFRFEKSHREYSKPACAKDLQAVWLLLSPCVNDLKQQTANYLRQPMIQNEYPRYVKKPEDFLRQIYTQVPATTTPKKPRAKPTRAQQMLAEIRNEGIAVLDVPTEYTTLSKACLQWVTENRGACEPAYRFIDRMEHGGQRPV